MKKPLIHTVALGIIMAASYPAAAQTSMGSSGTSGSNATGNTMMDSNTTGSSSSTTGDNSSSGMSGASGSNSSNSSSWDAQNQYWRSNYSKRPYYNSSMDYSNYEPAYRYGTELYNQNSGRSYNELNQEQLRNGWNQARGSSNMSWEDAQAATRDAYNRMAEVNRMGGKENIRSGTSSTGASGGTLGGVGTGSRK
jgi:hypothetical protein